MSFVDLATLTFHRRNELESRIQVFDVKCDRAIEDIKKLKSKAHSFVPQLNCEPAELKDRFLQFIQKLEEYQYLVTDFNLAISQIEDLNTTDYTPVQDRTILLPSASPFNLIDALSETAPSTSCTCSHLCPPEQPKPVKVAKGEQVLIAFSTSTSSESVPEKKVELDQAGWWKKKEENAEEEVVVKEVENLTVQEEPQEPDSSSQALDDTDKSFNLPPQEPLELGHVYSGIIMYVDGSHFFIITDDPDEVRQFMQDMNEYYFNNKTKVTAEDVQKMLYCAYYDAQSDTYYRALCLKSKTLDSNKKIQVYAVDLGELQTVSVDVVQPLVPQFCQRPPYARPCFLAGVDLTKYEDSELMKKQEAFIKQYIGVVSSFQVDDDTSEALGVYVMLPLNESLNEKFIRAGLGDPIDDKLPMVAAVEPKKVVCGPPPECSDYDSDIDITDLPEHEDPVEAVTGYHNRDEIDICKFYKGGPEKTCFKGSKCKKRHVMKHPDGWTLDRVEVPAKVKSVRLPAPDTYHTVRVTCVPHYDRVYVHIVTDTTPQESAPEFGVILPPTTLKTLVQDMNSAATRTAYQKLKLIPAPGELVAAIYPMDQCWYRARVLSVTTADQSVEVIYIDYGTVLWIKADQIRALDRRFLLLPAQAIRCVIAGIEIQANCEIEKLAEAKAALASLVQDAKLTAHVISREYDEITVDLIDKDGYSISQQLASMGLVDLREYKVIETLHRRVVD